MPLFMLDADLPRWCINARYGFAHIRERLPQADHLLFFHFLVEGRCKVRSADGADAIEAQAGDLILFARTRSTSWKPSCLARNARRIAARPDAQASSNAAPWRRVRDGRNSCAAISLQPRGLFGRCSRRCRESCAPLL